MYKVVGSNPPVPRKSWVEVRVNCYKNNDIPPEGHLPNDSLYLHEQNIHCTMHDTQAQAYPLCTRTQASLKKSSTDGSL